MRVLPFLIVLGLTVGTVGGCRCGADVASPVTLRIKNTNNDPIYVDATGGALGMQVQRNVLGNWIGFVEQPPCACLACEQICRGCDCQPRQKENLVQKVPGGGALERPWNGIVQVEGVSSCGAVIGGTSCLKAEIPSVDETFRVRFCYAPSAPGINDTTDGGTPVAGTLKPDSLLCVNREFRVADGVVEVSPAKGADCTSHAQCQGDGGTSLCFNGACTTSCPANDFPQLGGTWAVSVPEQDDLGFFNFTTEGQNKIYSGTGTVSSVRYDNNITTLRLQLGSLLHHAPRTPLAPEVQARLERSMRQVKRLGTLVESLLDVSRLSSGELSVALERLDLTERVRGVVERYAAEAEGVGSELRVSGPPGLWGRWDRARLEQSVAALVSNALKFGPGRLVEVEVSRAGPMGRVRVLDRGIGIAEDQLERIFERFGRAVSSRSYGGLGLGLYLARRAAETHGGRAWAEPREGGGAIFTLELPLEKEERE